MNFKRLILFLLLSSIISLYGLAQDDFLPRTIVFKVNEDYNNKCFSNYIDIPSFQQLYSKIGVIELKKVFPNKQKEQRDGWIDLSLIYQLKYNSNYSENKVVSFLRKLNCINYAELYYLPKLCYTPNDTVLPNQWHLPIIDAFNAWNITKGDSNIVIGITDTGWEPTHPDMIGNVKKNYADPVNGTDDDGDGYIDNFIGWDLANDDNDALWESISHGVNVTGIGAAATDNVTGVAGVGFNTSFLPVKISNSTGILTHAYQGIVYAADHGCDIINCSWGSFTYSQFNQDVIDYAVINKSCLVIAAVGNNNMDVKFYPAAYKGVLSVAATEQSDLKKNNSNYGYYVDVSAPGEAIQTTGPNASYSINSGTSMAAPIVAGAAALFKTQFPFYTNQQIGALIQATADDIYSLNPSYIDKLGTGRVNLFAGVNAVNPKFIELTNQTLTDNNNEIFEFGDTIEIVGLFTNYLDPLSGLTVTVTSTSPYVNILDGVTALPNLASMQTHNNTADPFTVEVLSGAPFNEEVTFKAVITNGTYTNNEYFTVVFNPDYINLEENQVATTITSNGKIGFNDINNSVGLGFTYNSTPLLYEAGLMIGDGVARVADVVRNGSGGQDQDFSAIQNVQHNPPYVSAKDLIGVLDDSPLSSPMDIEVKQYSYAYANAPDDKYVMVKYVITNTGLTTLNNLYAGIFADWDIKDAMQNKAGYDATRKMGYVYALDSDSLYAAIKVLSFAAANNYSLDLDGSSGIDPNGSGYTTDEKYLSLSTNKNEAGNPTGADVAHVVSSGSFNLLPGDSINVAFAIIAGDSLLDIQASADAAQVKYDLEVGIEELGDENEVVIYPNPTTGVIQLLSDEVIKQVTVKNMLGEEILTTKQKTIDLSNYPNGIYLVEIETEKEVVKKKAILSR